MKQQNIRLKKIVLIGVLTPTLFAHHAVASIACVRAAIDCADFVDKVIKAASQPKDTPVDKADLVIKAGQCVTSAIQCL